MSTYPQPYDPDQRQINEDAARLAAEYIRRSPFLDTDAKAEQFAKICDILDIDPQPTLEAMPPYVFDYDGDLWVPTLPLGYCNRHDKIFIREHGCSLCRLERRIKAESSSQSVLPGAKRLQSRKVREIVFESIGSLLFFIVLILFAIFLLLYAPGSCYEDARYCGLSHPSPQEATR